MILSSNLLLKPMEIGSLILSNRIAMAPMTRGRAKSDNYVPTELMAKYYAQRATAGLILTEGTWVSEQAVGFVNVPGIFTKEQAEGWRKVTHAVHEKGGVIFSQLGHAGVLSHPDYFNGELPGGPSAVNPKVMAFTPAGPKDTVTPRVMTIEEIHQTVKDYKVAAQYAKDAGFDGIEIHAQHPSLLSQFMSDTLNVRTDEYGGNMENRARLLFEVVEAVSSVWGSKGVSVRVHPYLNYSVSLVRAESSLPMYEYVIRKLNDYDLAFLDVLDRPMPGGAEEDYVAGKIFETVRPWYNGVIMANGGLTQERADELIAEGLADIVSFGSLFIANPDLVYRFERGVELNEGDPASYMMGDEKGYTDYAFAVNG